ncbi:MAG: hypothetical protein PHG29_07165 [Prolixibacteraceae bacterium]|nr:hypothetical protein [Prolixibacteraceae bacterium]
MEKVIPQIANFGFMADSIRIPTISVTLIALNITFSSRINENGMPSINAESIKEIYRKAAEEEQKGLLGYSTCQNVSSDLLGYPAAIVIESNEIHTRTGFLNIPPDALSILGISSVKNVGIPVTHAKIMGWYDNEYGSYVNCLGKLTEYIALHNE